MFSLSLHWATAFDTTVPIFSEVTLSRPHDVLPGGLAQEKQEAPLARWSRSELGGGVRTSVVCSISIPRALSIPSFTCSLLS